MSEPFGWVVERSLFDRLSEAAGSAIGWTAYAAARAGSQRLAEQLADFAIALHREGQGAIRAIGLLSALRGRRAGRRGRLLVRGQMRDDGRFANLGFYATYDVAAFNKERALELIRRFESGAVPESLAIEDGTLDDDDPGAEGVLWIARGKTYYSD